MKKAPWQDLNNQDLYEGDTIEHPDESKGIIVYVPNAGQYDTDKWKVDYGDKYLSRLCLQIGYKGRAIKVTI